MSKLRKPRPDRSYLIYRIRCEVNGALYVGLVVRRGRAVQKTLARRLRQHIDRALSLGREWVLHQEIRKYGGDQFTIGLIEVVRGKRLAHRREVEIAHQLGATLNTRLRRQ